MIIATIININKLNNNSNNLYKIIKIIKKIIISTKIIKILNNNNKLQIQIII